jgi:hypothetical protein
MKQKRIRTQNRLPSTSRHSIYRVNAVLAEDIEEKPLSVSPYLIEEPDKEAVRV